MEKVFLEVSIDEYIGWKVMKLREAKKIRQGVFAEKLEGISPQYLSFLEHGKRSWKPGTLQKVAEALKVDIMQLVPSTPVSEKDSVEARENQRNQELSQAKQDEDDRVNL